MHKTYDDVKDEHVGHTEENPDSTCYLCRKYGWIEEDKKEESGQSDFMQNLIDEKIQRLEELEQDFEEHTIYDGSLRQKKKEYNRILGLLRSKGLELEEKSKRVIDGDEASGYGKKVI